MGRVELRAQQLRADLAAGELEDLHADSSLSSRRRDRLRGIPDRTRAGFALSHERLGELKRSLDRFVSSAGVALEADDIEMSRTRAHQTATAREDQQLTEGYRKPRDSRSGRRIFDDRL